MRWNNNLNQIPSVAMALLVVSGVAGFGITAVVGSRIPTFAGLIVGVYLLFSIKVADQWVKVAVLRLGRFIGLRGPGLFHMIPIVDALSKYVDQRVRVASVTAESTLTRDTVPVNVDAIVFWMVWNAEKSILEVEDFVQAITMSAQTGLRESIGRHELAQMITERETLGRELQRILDEKTNPWGITVQSVEIRDVRIPQGLEDAMSQPGTSRTRATGTQHPGPGRDRDRRQVFASRCNLSGQSRSPPSARNEHAL